MNEILQRLNKVKKSGRGYIALCPCHQDKNPSLSISQADDGRVLICCFAGCCTKDILNSLGLNWRDLYPGEMNDRQQKNNDAFKKRQSIEELNNQAFLGLLDFRDLTKEVFKDAGLDIPDGLEKAVHLLPQIDYWLEILATGSRGDRDELFRQGVIQKWAKLHQLTGQAK